MVETRSATSSPIKRAVSTVTAIAHEEHDPLKVLVLPSAISPDARILLLRHPRNGARTRFLFCPQAGLYEFTRLSTPSIDPRSVLFTAAESIPDKHGPTLTGKKDRLDGSSTIRVGDGYVNKDADTLIATPFDVVFLLLQLIAPQDGLSKKAMFQPLDDLLDIPDTEDKQFKFVLENGRPLIECAMDRICDSVDAGDERMFRYSESRTMDLMLEKAKRVVANGLPASMEERFVSRALEAPVMSIKREDTSTSITTTPDILNDSADSQSSTASSTVSVVFSEISTISTVPTQPDRHDALDMRYLQRMRTALSFIAASYLSTDLAAQLLAGMSREESPISFAPLDAYLKHLASLRAEALASRSMSDFSRKRSHADDDEAAEDRAEKKRKQEEDEKKRKANESRGVRDLKKVNVTGMKKMSDFFSRKPLAKGKS